MGKNKNSSFETMRDLQEERKKLEKKMAKVKIPCSHTNSNGKIKVEFRKGTIAECKKCGCVFDFERISDEDLNDAVEVIHNAINQIKALSNDPEKEMKIIETLGQIDYSLSELAELYTRTVSKYGKGGKKNKNKNKNNDSIGSYGVGNLDLLGGKNRRRY